MSEVGKNKLVYKLPNTSIFAVGQIRCRTSRTRSNTRSRNAFSSGDGFNHAYRSSNSSCNLQFLYRLHASRSSLHFIYKFILMTTQKLLRSTNCAGHNLFPVKLKFISAAFLPLHTYCFIFCLLSKTVISFPYFA